MNLAAFFKKLSQSKAVAQKKEKKETTQMRENPYLTARRTWNDQVGALVSSRQAWQIVGILSLLITLISVVGLLHISSQSRFIPYVVEVDKVGQMIANHVATPTSKTDPKIVRAFVADFIARARLVTPDLGLQGEAVRRVYAALAPNEPGLTKINEWYLKTEQSKPTVRAETEMVSTEIKSILAQSPNTWQVEWLETTRDRQGVIKGKPALMRALVTVATTGRSEHKTEAALRQNPFGIYIQDFSWSLVQ